MAKIIFNKEIERLVKEGIDGNGFVSWGAEIDELLNLLTYAYLDEFSELGRLEPQNKINDNKNQHKNET
ncbi:MAG: hypothetical protein M1276_08765 [Deltaproteobacteria bacterium]|jgi:hypothetical protein|nr:hypothetical protein [Deltaproteobacteria bacterium]